MGEIYKHGGSANKIGYGDRKAVPGYEPDLNKFLPTSKPKGLAGKMRNLYRKKAADIYIHRLLRAAPVMYSGQAVMHVDLLSEEDRQWLVEMTGAGSAHDAVMIEKFNSHVTSYQHQGNPGTVGISVFDNRMKSSKTAVICNYNCRASVGGGVTMSPNYPVLGADFTKSSVFSAAIVATKIDMLDDFHPFAVGFEALIKLCDTKRDALFIKAPMADCVGNTSLVVVDKREILPAGESSIDLAFQVQERLGGNSNRRLRQNVKIESVRKQVPCKYGEKCFRVDVVHRTNFSHHNAETQEDKLIKRKVLTQEDGANSGREVSKP